MKFEIAIFEKKTKSKIIILSHFLVVAVIIVVFQNVKKIERKEMLICFLFWFVLNQFRQQFPIY